MKKLAFSLVTAVRKRRPYFQAHVINILTDYLLKMAMNKLEALRQLIQQAMELSEFDVRYQTREAIKAQALAGFVAEFTPAHDRQSGDQGAKQWVIRVDARPYSMQKELEQYCNHQRGII